MPPARAPRGSSMVKRAAGWTAIALGCLAAVAGAASALYAISRHVASGNSDGATVVLEGQAMSAGHLLLSGWSLSLDSFWTIDALFYALAVHTFGVNGALLNAVPTLIAVLVITLAAALATDGNRRLPALGGALATMTVLALPSRAMALFFVQGPLHVATLLWCLVAFVALADGRFGWRWALGLVVLTAGVLGDLQTVVLGALPLLVVGLLCAHLSQRLQPGASLLAAPFAAGVLAVVVRESAKIFGTFVVPRENTFASFHQLARNVARLPGILLNLLGMGNGPFFSTGIPLVLEALRILGLAVVLGGPFVVAIDLIRKGRVARRSPREVTTSLRVDALLLAAFVCSIGTFVVLPITDSDGYARYLIPAIVIGATLGGRVLTRELAARPRPEAVRIFAGVALLVGVFGASFGFELSGRRAPQPAAKLATFLISHHLHHGLGDYWDASVITVVSKGHVDVRPVITSPGGLLVRYEKQSCTAWYGRPRFNFLVYNTGEVWNDVDTSAALATFGQPRDIYTVGTYRVLVWPSPFTVSTKGSTGP